MKIIMAFFVMFFACQWATGQDVLIQANGKVYIGDTTNHRSLGPYTLYVDNGILTEKVKVALRNSAAWADHAFAHLPAIDLVKKTIEEKSHLPSMPSAAQLVKEGYDIQNMDAKLLTQVEWLWLYTIQLKEENELLRKELEEIKELLKKDK